MEKTNTTQHKIRINREDLIAMLNDQDNMGANLIPPTATVTLWGSEDTRSKRPFRENGSIEITWEKTS